jgi:hypothetical protein
MSVGMPVLSTLSKNDSVALLGAPFRYCSEWWQREVGAGDERGMATMRYDGVTVLARVDGSYCPEQYEADIW